MAVMIVTYELRKPGKNYQALYDLLKRFTYCHSTTSCWFIDTTSSAETVREQLRGVIDQDDSVFVARLSGEWASFKVPCADWLNAPGRSW